MAEYAILNDPKLDCFAVNGSRRGGYICQALSTSSCEGCVFYKTKAQCEEEWQREHGTTNFKEIKKQYEDELETLMRHERYNKRVAECQSDPNGAAGAGVAVPVDRT